MSLAVLMVRVSQVMLWVMASLFVLIVRVLQVMYPVMVRLAMPIVRRCRWCARWWWGWRCRW